MNGKKELVEMAHKAGLCDKDGCDDNSISLDDAIERFAQLVAAAERKDCILTASIALLGTEKELADRVLNALLARGQQ